MRLPATHQSMTVKGRFTIAAFIYFTPVTPALKSGSRSLPQLNLA
jgi:hypothetical protein